MPQSATVIGRVAIKVVPDTEDFRGDAKRALTAIEKSLPKIKVDFEVPVADLVRDTRRAVRQAEAQIRDSLKVQLTPHLDRTQMRRVRRDLDGLDANVHVRLGELALRTTQARLAYLARPRQALIAPKIDKSAAARAATALAALSGGRAIGNSLEDFGTMLGNLDRTAGRISAVSLAVTNLTGYLATASSNLLTFGGSLATTAGAALALPGIFAGFGFGLGATVAVLKDFNEVIPDVGERLSDLQDRMSDRFWRRAERPIETFIDSLFPQFAAGLEETSSSLGDFFASLANSATGQFNGELEGMFADLAESIRVSGEYTDNFVGVLAKLGEVGAGNLPRLARYFGEITQDFDEWLGRKGPDGLQAFVDRGVDALKDLGGVLNATGGTLAGLAEAAERAGGSTLATVRATMESVERTVNDASFQGSLTQAFRAAHQGMSELAREAGPEFRKFTEELVDTLTHVLPTAGRTAGKAFGGLFDALSTPRVQDAVIGLFDSIETAVDNLVGTLPQAAQGFAGILDGVGALADSISNSIAPIIENLGPKIDSIAQDLVPVISVLGDFTAAITTIASTVIAAIPNSLLIMGAALGGALLLFVKAKLALDRLGVALAKAGVSFGGFAAGAARARAATAGFAANVGVIATSMGRAGTRTQQESQRMNAALRSVATSAGKAGLAVGAIAALSTGAADGLGVTNTATLGLLGASFGAIGAAAGVAAGYILDMAAGTRKADDAVKNFHRTVRDADSLASYSKAVQTLSDNYTDFLEKTGAKAAGERDLFGFLKKSLTPTGFGNNLDVLFGGVDSSKGGKLAKELDAAKVAADDLAFSASRLAVEYGLAGDAGSATATQIDQALTNAKPAMDALGIGIENFITAAGDGTIYELIGQITDYQIAADSAAGRMTGLGTAVAGLDNNLISTADSTNALSQALNAVLSPTLGAEEATDRWKQSLSALSTQMNAAAGFEGFTKAALANKEASRQYVADTLTMLTARAQAGASAATIAQKINQARDAFIAEGRAAGFSEKAIAKRADAMGLTPDLIRTVFKADGLQFTKSQVDSLNTSIKRLPKKVPVEFRARADAAAAQAAKVRGELDEIKRTNASASVSIKDAATKPVDALNRKLRALNEQSAKPTVSINDKASRPISGIASRLSGLQSRTVTVTVIENRQTSSGSPGGPPKKSGRLAIKGVTERIDERKILPSPERLAAAALRAARTISTTLSANLRQRADKIRDLITDLLKVTPKREREATAMAFNAQITTLNKQRLLMDQRLKQLDSAKARLTAALEEAKQFRASVLESFQQAANPVSFGATTYAGILRGMERSALNAGKFEKAIGALIKAGLNDTTLRQLVTAGPEAGLKAAEAILSGGVGDINKYQAQITKAGTNLGKQAADDLYGALITKSAAQVQALVRTLQPLQNKLKTMAATLVATLVEELRKETAKAKARQKSSSKRPVIETATVSKRATVAGSVDDTDGYEAGDSFVWHGNYYAAPNNSLDSEESLFDAFDKVRGGYR